MDNSKIAGFKIRFLRKNKAELEKTAKNNMLVPEARQAALELLEDMNSLSKRKLNARGLSFDLYENFSIPDTTENERLVYEVWCIALIILGLNYFGWLNINIWLGVVLISSLMLPSLIWFYGTMHEEIHTKDYLGNIKFSVENINWKGRDYKWNEFKTIKVSYRDFKEKNLRRSSHSSRNHLSCGVKNEIYLETKKGETLKANFLIPHKNTATGLKNLFWEVITQNYFTFENAKNLIHPSTYAEHQKIRKVMNQQRS